MITDAFKIVTMLGDIPKWQNLENESAKLAKARKCKEIISTSIMLGIYQVTVYQCNDNSRWCWYSDIGAQGVTNDMSHIPDNVFKYTGVRKVWIE